MDVNGRYIAEKACDMPNNRAPPNSHLPRCALRPRENALLPARALRQKHRQHKIFLP